jgi:hypothetical protein
MTSCFKRQTAASFCAASYARTARTASASSRRKRVHLDLRDDGDLLDHRRLLLVVENVIRRLEDGARQPDAPEEDPSSLLA